MIVVTGAAGLIGSNVIARLNEIGRGPIAAVDWFSDPLKLHNLRNRTIEVFLSPDQSSSFLESNRSRISAVIHMGAISDTTERSRERLVRWNVAASVMYWDWCTKHEVPFIYASSAAVYGADESVFSDDDSPAAITALSPLNLYGWSKKEVDKTFADRVAQGTPRPPQWVGLRFFNVYGPNEYHKGEMKSIALKLYEAAHAGRTLRLFKSHRKSVADGEQQRDFVYVSDCSRAISWLLDHPQISGIYNLGTGVSCTFLDVLRSLERAMGTNLPLEFIEMPPLLRDQYQYFTRANMSKARGCGLNMVFTSLESGIEDYVNRYLIRESAYR